MSKPDTNPIDPLTRTTYEMRKVAVLQNWDQNPRTITDKEFERLQEHIRRLGVYKPLLINQSNIVLGGNMRLRALKDLGVEEVMCAVVLTDNMAQMIEYSLSDNDQMGTTDEQKLAELVTITPIKTELFAIQTGPVKPIENVLRSVSPDGTQPEAKPATSCTCPNCGHTGTLDEFRTKDE